MKNWLIKHKKLHRLSQRVYHELYKRHFYALTGPIRSLPDFIIIGTARSGTTSLYYNLCEHPCIISAAHDELGFFDSNFNLGLNWYRSFFPTILHKYFVKISKKYALTGEDTPFYIWNPIAANRILKLIPKVKLIVLFRNPIDRAYSNYYLGIRSKSESLSFEEAINSELKLLEDTQGWNSDNDIEKYTIPRSYIAKGIYSSQLKIWFNLFSQKQLYIVSTEEFSCNPQETLDKIFKFLGVPKYKIKNLQKYKVANYPEMKPETRKFLIDYFKPHNQQLYNMLNRKFDWDK